MNPTSLKYTLQSFIFKNIWHHNQKENTHPEEPKGVAAKKRSPSRISMPNTQNPKALPKEQKANL
jgi:hypothetical protein